MKSIYLTGCALLSSLTFSHADDISDLKAKIAELEGRQNALAESLEGKSSITSKTHLGGYGELHYTNLDGKGTATDKDEIDFHRFVLLISHEFSDKITLYSELELEHAFSGGGAPGEVELEQAYLDIKLNESHHLKAGLFLVPVGMINETHEPETFYGVERNPVEKNILPTTWWEAGVGMNGNWSEHFGYDVAVHSGLNTNAAKSYAVRDGRKKVASAPAKDFAYTARLRWMPLSNLNLSVVGQYQGDMTQSTDTAAGSATLLNINLEYRHKGFGLRALYATWSLDGTGPQTAGSDEQSGYYIEPSYKLCEQLGIFARYNVYDNKATVAGNQKEQWDFGVNYWIHPQVVLKADYQLQNNEDSKDQNGFNLGLGFSF